MDRLLPLKKFTLSTIHLENIWQRIKSTAQDVLDEKPLPVVLGISGVLVTSTVYIYYRHKYSYWERKGIPYPPVAPFFGHILDLSGPLVTYDNWQRKYGPVVGIYRGTEPTLVVTDAGMIHEVLVGHFDTFSKFPSELQIKGQSFAEQNGWKRSIVSSAFASDKMKQLLPLIREVYKYLDSEVEQIADEVPIKPLFTKFATMFIARTAFGTHIDAFENTDHQLIEMLTRWAKFTPRTFTPHWAEKLFRYKDQDPEAFEYLTCTLKEVVKERRKNPNAHEEYKDLLQFMINARLDDDEITSDGETTQLSDLEIIESLICFSLKSYETTSTLLTWTCHSLAMDTDIQERLYQEIKDTKDEVGELDSETLSEMKYLGAVLKETLRMYPPVLMMERKSLSKHTFANGVSIEKNTWVLIPIYSAGRNPESWPDPDTFRPERFLLENRHKIKPCSFLAFSEGPRTCIGHQFAMFQVGKAICELLFKYKFIRTTRTPEKPIFDKNSIALEAGEIILKVERRNP